MGKTAAKKTPAKKTAANNTPAETAAAPKAKREATTKAGKGMPPPSQEQISRVAYQLWEEAGRPHGRSETFWSQAERKLRG